MAPSGIITLTTDFGLIDPFVAEMKGAILSVNSRARIVDIGHQVMPGALLQAGGMIAESFPFFPEGTVHVAVVDPGVGTERRPIALGAGGHLFVGPDNGLLWPVIEGAERAKIVALTERKFFRPQVSSTFHGRDLFAPVAAHLSLGVPLEKMGPQIKDPVALDLPVPQEKEGVLQGQVLRVDRFGNLITNIMQRELEGFLGSSVPVIEVGRLRVNRFGRTYADVREGEALGLIGSSGRLEIAVNRGRASDRTDMDGDALTAAPVKVTRSGQAS